MSSAKLPKKTKVNFPIQWIFLLVIGLILVYQFMDMPGGPKEIGSSEFKRDVLAQGKVKKIVIVKEKAKENSDKDVFVIDDEMLKRTNVKKLI